MQKRTSEIYENAQLPVFAPQQRKPKSTRHILTDLSEEDGGKACEDLERLESIVSDIAQLMSVEMDSNETILHKDYLTRMADRIDAF